MTMTRLRWTIVGIGAALALILVTRPWVVRPLDAEGRAAVGPVQFDPDTAVAEAWAARLPQRVAAATDARQAGPSAAFLKGEGQVIRVDTSSRVGVALVDLDPQDGEPDVALQVGPVITGTALRDALGLGFGDFETQIDFANVGNALNRKALQELPLLSDPQALEGRRVSFVGAGAATTHGPVRIVPVRLTLLP